MVQYEILTRTFCISHESSKATAFTIEENDIQYLVTAKHFFKDIGYPATATINILINGQYHDFNVIIKYPQDDIIDIAVMKTTPYCEISKKMGNGLTSKGLIYGCDVYFLGYPFNYDELLTTFPSSSTPIPFIKKATFSGTLKQNQSILFLDGHNNPGFSGGPVCFKNDNDSLFTIAGVISGYNYNRKPVFDSNSDKETPFYIQENTGIIYAYDISYAVNLTKNWDI